MMLPGPMAFARMLCGASASAMHLHSHMPAAALAQPPHRAEGLCVQHCSYSGSWKRSQQELARQATLTAAMRSTGKLPVQ